MSVVAIDPEQVRADAELALVDARIERERLSLDALAGDAEAAAQLAEVEAEIAGHERRRDLASLAGAERTRREQKQAEQAEQKALERARAEHERLDRKREEMFTAVRAQAVALAEMVSTLIELDRKVMGAAVMAGTRPVSIAQPVAEVVIVTLRDAGVTVEPVPFVPAAVRRRLLDRYPDLTAPTPAEPVGRCSVCEHEAAAAIGEALASGAALRALEAEHGLSRSALSRHRQHAQT